MEQREIVRFRKRTVAIHWIFALLFLTMMVTGGIIFFDLTGIYGATLIRNIHRVSALLLIMVPVSFALFDPWSAVVFLKQTFSWDRNSYTWLRSSLKHYFKGNREMPAQGYLNGDQRLWQLVVFVFAILFIFTGALLWFFKFKITWVLYQWILMIHAGSFLLVYFFFLIHIFLVLFHPNMNGSLNSMVDGKISETYAKEHHADWYSGKYGIQ